MEHKPGISEAAKKLYSIIRAWFFLPLVATLVSAMLITRITNRFLGPNSYKIYIVGNMDGSQVAQRIYDGFDAGRDGLKDLGGVPLEIVERSDHGDPAQARQVAEKITRQSDTLLVVGHMASSQSKEAVPIYLGARPPIPVILTTETNPDLVPPKIRKHVYRPVFHLSPNDKEQARFAANFVAEHANLEHKTIWVVQDASRNTVYSDFLANEFIKQVQLKQAKVVLWSTNLNVPSAEVLRALNVRWIFFAGGWQSALILIRAVRLVYGNSMPGIVLSHASANQQLIDEGGSDVEDVFLTVPMKVSQYQRGQGYGVYGNNASKILQTLVQEANNEFDEIAARDGGLMYRLRSVLGIKRVEDARRVLSSVMEDAEETREAFNLSDGNKVRFGVDDDGEDGVRVDPDAKFYIWQVKGGGFADVGEQTTMAASERPNPFR